MKRFLLQKFLGDQRGNILILTGLGFLFLVGIGGAGYDLGRQQLVRQKIQQASDAAALAAAGLDFGTSDATRQNTAQAFFALNYPADYLGIARPTPSISIAGEIITVSANASVPTSFVVNFGVSSIAANGSSRTQFKRLQTVIDTILVMDNSASMNIADVGTLGIREVPSNLVSAYNSTYALRCSTLINSYFRDPIAQSLLNDLAVLFGQGNARSTLNRDINIFLNSCAASSAQGATGATRLNALRSAAYNFTTSLLGNNNPNGNRIAIVGWSDLVLNSQALSSNFNTVVNTVDMMSPQGGTNSALGLQEAQVLSAAFNRSHARSIVLLTDGSNTASALLGAARIGLIPPNSYTYLLSDGNGCDGNNYCQPSVDDSLAICNNLKNSGIQIFTIAFGNDVITGPNAARVESFLRACANPEVGGFQYFYPASDAAALDAAFSAIAGSLKKVQILQ